ncbi:MAG TPA: protein kinase, partial [Planctomycetota bacterium]|nr:protein kinase [Planctomycetota bacterium]
GMGDVYRAHDDELDRDVAVKTISKALSADPSFVVRFKEEARAAAKLSHGNIVQVHAAGETEGTLYFAMELVPGRSLGDRLRDGPVEWHEAVRYTVQAARGLEAAATHGIVHRDVKPENLLVSTDGHLKVADFGLAKRLQENGVNTASGIIVGTPRYMSPEQAQGEALDFRADMYSLGATLFHLVAGRPVFDGASAMKLCMKHIQEPPPALSSVAPQAPEALSRCVGRMLAKRKEERHPSYAALCAELEALLAGAFTPASPTVIAPTPVPPAPTPPGGSLRPIVQIVKRADGGVEVGLACPTPLLDERIRVARAAAPIAPRGRRLVAALVDFSTPVVTFEALSLLPWWPGSPFTQTILALILSFVWTQWFTRRGGTPGERLTDVRLVSRNGAYPEHAAVGIGWFLQTAFPLIVFVCMVDCATVVNKIGNGWQVFWCCAGLAGGALLEYGSAFLTLRSYRDRIFGTRVVDVHGLPDESS